MLAGGRIDCCLYSRRDRTLDGECGSSARGGYKQWRPPPGWKSAGGIEQDIGDNALLAWLISVAMEVAASINRKVKTSVRKQRNM